MILHERKLEGFDRTVTLELDGKNVQVNIRDSLGTVEWARNTEDGKLALDMFRHPFAFGYDDPCGSG